jgi:hypothetical protein
MNDFRTNLDASLRAAWLVVSFVILLILISPFALGRDRIARLTPVCQSKLRTGTPCSFCGMTTSFLAVSEGRLGDARRANRGGPLLYGLFVLNEFAVLLLLKRGGLVCKYSA